MIKSIDLRGTPCPINFVRCRLELEKLNDEQILQIDLDRGEPEEMVLSGLKDEGHNIQIILEEKDWIRLRIISNARD
ncbi:MULTISPECIES: sulfurtransferase TusA family protein [Prochlorococcus]|uniref:Predicted redox protein n=1 Tax=Prochlorococcus marinus (strain SARG / CCMP1375 / SS120) TaxID=167539 RepID=Q7VEJ5_PROMA|nr:MULTISPECIES: sulfurtransferase TusA family protein [Prochlorococcus]AAP99064.1 Predicted redox protein [Prochlorococcus marinus subsp. marinus str. CCMP1375]KGG11680.1 hypothetical protein EV04_0968 [Prochlorococcus marinus str. LG]KGG22312.1 hypothetical protein EV08_0129 [Prochlorococcus marinus str. SS2]KGG22649.1 hypothetical protein EV09_1387 [Prochlorococcus marinus str. SS35]KGG32930.1 hypothetical protein EV10_0911 [Prochlorococcus marinus str. SS51]